MTLIFVIMVDTVQSVLAALVVLSAVIATLRAVMRSVNNKKSPLTACESCKLKDVCQKTEKNSAKKCADKVAQVEK